MFHEAKRTAPSVIYMPFINELWGVVSDSLRVTFLTLVRSMNPSAPVLLFATSEAVYGDLDDQVQHACLVVLAKNKCCFNHDLSVVYVLLSITLLWLHVVVNSLKP